jgi:hypothetical protein
MNVECCIPSEMISPRSGTSLGEMGLDPRVFSVISARAIASSEDISTNERLKKERVTDVLGNVTDDQDFRKCFV